MNKNEVRKDRIHGLCCHVPKKFQVRYANTRHLIMINMVISFPSINHASSFEYFDLMNVYF